MFLLLSILCFQHEQWHDIEVPFCGRRIAVKLKDLSLRLAGKVVEHDG